MVRPVLQSFVAVMTAVLFTQCSSVPGAGGSSREERLTKMGYVAIPLQKVTDDVRYSGTFKVNGEPLRFLIDSGANSTDVDHATANRIGLERSKTVKVVTRGALGREIKSGLGRGSLQVGPMMADDFPFTIAPPTKRKTSTSRYGVRWVWMRWMQRERWWIFRRDGCGAGTAF